MVCSIRALTIGSRDDALRELLAIGVAGSPCLTGKMLHYTLRVDGIGRTEGVMISDQLSSVGGAAAMGKFEDDLFTVILAGTHEQLRLLSACMMGWDTQLQKLAGEIERLLTLSQSHPVPWNLRTTSIDVGSRPRIMGILNVTPDSFSDGSLFNDPVCAVEHALSMENDGADIIDIGGESTRPSSDPVSADEELRRIMPVIERLVPLLRIPISIDTTKAIVAREALAAGAEIINDISGLSFDPALAGVVSEFGAGVVLMHTRGTPKVMQNDTSYTCLMGDIVQGLRQSISRARLAGIRPDQIVVDPGIGFGKDMAGNLQILRRLRELKILGQPVLVGTSRKAFIGKILGREPHERAYGTAATVAVSLMNGASLFRVHDVREMRDVADMAAAVVAS
jgi:dihydropteroate synthase